MPSGSVPGGDSRPAAARRRPGARCRHGSHSPQDGAHESTTRSPGARSRTTALTDGLDDTRRPRGRAPSASAASTRPGRGGGPSRRCRPPRRRTSTSPGPGGVELDLADVERLARAHGRAPRASSSASVRLAAAPTGRMRSGPYDCPRRSATRRFADYGSPFLEAVAFPAALPSTASTSFVGARVGDRLERVVEARVVPVVVDRRGPVRDDDRRW